MEPGAGAWSQEPEPERARAGESESEERGAGLPERRARRARRAESGGGGGGATGVGIPFEQKEPDYLLWGPLCSSFASANTPAGCLLQLKHGLDEGARGAKSQRKKKFKQRTVNFITRLLF
jgi:hypothetical protein